MNAFTNAFVVDRVLYLVSKYHKVGQLLQPDEGEITPILLKAPQPPNWEETVCQLLYPWHRVCLVQRSPIIVALLKAHNLSVPNIEMPSTHLPNKRQHTDLDQFDQFPYAVSREAFKLTNRIAIPPTKLQVAVRFSCEHERATKGKHEAEDGLRALRAMRWCI